MKTLTQVYDLATVVRQWKRGRQASAITRLINHPHFTIERTLRLLYVRKKGEKDAKTLILKRILALPCVSLRRATRIWNRDQFTERLIERTERWKEIFIKKSYSVSWKDQLNLIKCSIIRNDDEETRMLFDVFQESEGMPENVRILIIYAGRHLLDVGFAGTLFDAVTALIKVESRMMRK